jgi:hypothetical protein
MTRIKNLAAGATELEQVWGLRADYFNVFIDDYMRSVRRLDPVLVELCRLRIAQLVESEFDAALRYQPAFDAGRFYSEQELVDIVLLSMHTTASKATITLGLDPGKEASSRVFFPTEDVYGESPDLAEAVESLRTQGIVVDQPDDGPVPVGTTTLG